MPNVRYDLLSLLDFPEFIFFEFVTIIAIPVIKHEIIKVIHVAIAQYFGFEKQCVSILYNINKIKIF
jgi:hypothetical protein